MIDPANLVGHLIYVKGTNLQYTVTEVVYDKSCEDLCEVTMDLGYTPPTEILNICKRFKVRQLRDHNNCAGSIFYEATFRLSDISEVPFGSPLAQVIYGGK